MKNSNLLAITLPCELAKYDLIWDLGEGYISTLCASRKIAYEIVGILISCNIPAHLMHSDDRIIVIYIH